MLTFLRQLSNRNFSLLLSLVYVGIGTLYVSLTEHSEIDNGIIYYIFWPATSIASFLLFVGGGPLSFIIGEFFAFAFVFLVLHGFVISMRTDSKNLNNQKEEKEKSTNTQHRL